MHKIGLKQLIFHIWKKNSNLGVLFTGLGMAIDFDYFLDTQG